MNTNFKCSWEQLRAALGCRSSTSGDNVGALLEKMLKMADLARVEVHGPPEELEKLKAPLTHF
jgi:hypothetical protein